MNAYPEIEVSGHTYDSLRALGEDDGDDDAPDEPNPGLVAILGADPDELFKDAAKRKVSDDELCAAQCGA